MTQLRSLEIELMSEVSRGQDIERVSKAITIQKMNLNQQFSMKVATNLATYRSQIYEAGENAGQILAKRLQQKEIASRINHIQDHLGQIQDAPGEILKVFQKYYQELYMDQDISIDIEKKMKDFCTDMLIKKLTQEQNEILAAQIIWGEVEEAILSLAAGKAVGPDGIPLEFYKTFSQVLRP